MKNCIQLLFFLLKYIAFWIAFFVFFRTFFILYNYKLSADLTGLEILKTFWHGFPMDLSATVYISVFPIVVLLFSPIVRSKILYTIIFVYSLVIISIASIFGLLDIGLYEEWGMRLSPQILPALENPKGMLACVTGIQLVFLFLAEIGIVTGFFYLYRFLFKANNKQKKQKWWTVFILLCCGALLFIPMRGGIKTTPLNLSRVYFSSKLYANQTATNPYWSFFHRLINNEKNVKNVSFMKPEICETIMHNLIQNDQENIPIFIKPNNNQSVNVILVILESFSNKVIESLGGVPDITPNFNKLAKEGILFQNFYATGNRSDKGIGSLLSAYPALIGPYSILYFPEKMENLDYLSQYFTRKNYQTHFYYAGEVEFYNTKSLVLKSEYHNFVSVNDFPISAKQQKWGVPDQIFYKRIIEDFNTFSTPFFLVTYNISSHPPYDIPNMENKSYENAITYSDQWLGDFVTHLKKSDFWDNTLLIITSDHGSLRGQKSSISEPLTYQIPMLWIGGVVDTSFVNENIGMQTDVTTTLIQQLEWKQNRNSFSKNLFGKSSYAFYFNTNGYGFVSSELTYFNDTETNKIEYFNIKNEQKKDSLLKFSKAYVQFLHEDFKKR